jgi:RNA 3'-terminal phosphate cyclase (ATP)
MFAVLLEIDGSLGEGGGQILRSSLALSLVTGTPFRLKRIRAGREKPGLARQHLTSVMAAAEVGRAEVDGAAVGSQDLTFRPGRVSAGRFEFKIGTAGSTTLVLQTVLPALVRAEEPSTVIVEGGTHNTKAPPVDFLTGTFLPLVGKMGPRVSLELERHGFYPQGGGRITAMIEPASLRPLELLERGPVRSTRAVAIVSRLPRHVAERELAVVGNDLGWTDLTVQELDGPGQGNVLLLVIETDGVTETISAIGERGMPAERVADAACAEARRYLDSGVPVGEHLADQLMLPLALAGGGRYVTLAPTPHTTTHAEVIGKFLGVRPSITEAADGRFLVTVRP